MKKVILALLSFTIAFTSCDVEEKINETLASLVKFDFNNNATVEIPVAPAGKATIANTVNTDIEKLLSDNSFKQENIGDIKFKDLKLVVPTGQNFDIVKSISIRIKAGSLDFKDIVTIDNIGAGLSKLDLTPTVIKDNLFEFLINDKITYEVVIETKEAIVEPITININSIFTVSPKINL